MALTTSVISAYQDFLALGSEWPSLLQATEAHHVFCTHEWLRCWWESFGRPAALFTVCVRDGDRLVGVAPLLLTKSRFRGLPVRKLAFLANGYSDETGFILAPPEEEVLGAVLECLRAHRRRWDLLDLENMRLEPPMATRLLATLSRHGLHYSLRPGRQVPYIPIDGTWETFLSGRSRGFRKRIKRRAAAIARRPDPVRIVRSSSAAGAAMPIEDMLRVSKRSWKAREQWALTDLPAEEEFFRRLSSVLGQRGWVTAWMAYAGDTPIAFEYHLQYEGVTHPIRADFDESYGVISPGAYLEATILEELFREPGRPIVEYNTCGDEYAYELRWTDKLRDRTRVRVLAPSWYGAILRPLAWLRRPFRRHSPKGSQSCREQNSSPASDPAQGA